MSAIRRATSARAIWTAWRLESMGRAKRGFGIGAAGVAGRRARRVMVVAELLAAESEGAATMAGGMEMRAAELRIGDGGT